MAKNSLFDELRVFLQEIGAEKSASHRLGKRADAYNSSHPTEKVEDNTTEMPDSSREKEHDRDVKENVGAGNVVSSSENSLDDYYTNPTQGLNPSAVGEDKKTEENYKATKDDPGTSHPATTEDGEKYGSYSRKGFFELYKEASEKCNDILSVISVRLTQGNTERLMLDQFTPSQLPFTTTEKSAAAFAGANSVNLLDSATHDQFVKTAAIKQVIAQTIRDAYEAADLAAGYLGHYASAVKKAQEEERRPDEDQTGDGYSPPSDSRSVTEEAGGGPDSDEGDPDLGVGAEGEESGDAEDHLSLPVELGSVSEGAGVEGAGLPPEAASGMGDVDNPEAVKQLLMSLMEMGVTPEQLEEAVDNKSPQELGGISQGVPPDVAKTAGLLIKSGFKKLASAASKLVRQKVKKGNLAYRPPASRQELALREQVKSCIRDIMSL
jgi:hypothetical protein